MSETHIALGFVKVIYPLVVLCEWAVYAITVTRLRKKDAFGSLSKSGDRASNKSNSNDRDDTGDAGSRSRTNTTMRDKAVRGTQKRRIIYTGGFLFAMSIRAIDPLAEVDDAFLFVNLAATLFCAMFGILWSAYFAYGHLCAYYVAIVGTLAPKWAPDAHRAFEVYVVVGHSILIPLFAATRRADLVGATFIFSATPAFVFGVALLVTVNSLYKRLKNGEISKMIPSGRSYEARLKKVKRFHLLGNAMAANLLFCTCVATVCGVFCIVAEADDFADLTPIALNIIVWSCHIAPFIGVSIIQWVQWEPKYEKPRSEKSIPMLPSRASASALPRSSTPKKFPSLGRSSSVRPLPSTQGTLCAQQLTAAFDVRINVASINIDGTAAKEPHGTVAKEPRGTAAKEQRPAAAEVAGPHKRDNDIGDSDRDSGSSHTSVVASSNGVDSAHAHVGPVALLTEESTLSVVTIAHDIENSSHQNCDSGRMSAASTPRSALGDESAVTPPTTKNSLEMMPLAGHESSKPLRCSDSPEKPHAHVDENASDSGRTDDGDHTSAASGEAHVHPAVTPSTEGSPLVTVPGHTRSKPLRYPHSCDRPQTGAKEGAEQDVAPSTEEISLPRTPRHARSAPLECHDSQTKQDS